MEYITAEQFLEQDEKVQKVFLDWWQPDQGDLFVWIDDKTIDFVYDKGFLNSKDISCLKEYYKKVIPLLTEGQLRKFIEVKTGTNIDISYSKIGGYDFHLYNTEIIELFRNQFLVLEHDLLKAYWKVALEIAKESIE